MKKKIIAIPKSKWTETATKEAFEKILKPGCFGRWDCLIHPNKANPFYSLTGGSFEDIRKVCPYLERCQRDQGSRIRGPYVFKEK